MPGLSSFFGSDTEDNRFDQYDEFVPDHIPEPTSFLDGHDVLVDDGHRAFHRLTRSLFETRSVYDVTFGYNLARLNLDRNHPDAGFRYAVDRDDSTVLRAVFTPTTQFCPQAHTLTIAAFRAWNGLSDRHEYDLIRVRVAPSHQQSNTINEQLIKYEQRYLETGQLDDSSEEETALSAPEIGQPRGTASKPDEDAPF